MVCIFIETDTGSLDQRIRQQGDLDEEVLQSLLMDAAQQRHRLQALQEQQQLLKDQLHAQQQAAAACSGPTPGTLGTASAAVKSPAPSPKPAVQLPPVTLPSTPAPQRPAQPQQQLQWLWQTQPAAGHPVDKDCWIFAVKNPHKELQVCYTHIKSILARHLPCRERFQPGMLLLQHHPAAGELKAQTLADTSTSSRPTSSALDTTHSAGPVAASGLTAAGAASTSAATMAAAAAAQAAVTAATAEAVAAAEASGVAIDKDLFHTNNTVLRLTATTFASSQLLLPRGRHLLQLLCSPNQLHCVSLYASTEFTLDIADKLLPAACKRHVYRQSGETAALTAGSRQLLFR